MPVFENHCTKIVWDIPIPTDRDIVARRPDVFLQDKMNRHLYLIEPGVNKSLEAVQVWRTVRRPEETVPWSLKP